MLLAALAVGPAAWVVQQLLGYGVSSHACFPSDAPIGPVAPGWAGGRAAIAAVELVLLLATVIGVWIAYRAWRATREEKGGAGKALLEIGEGRSRFLASCGVLTGALFSVAILADLAVTLSLASCGTP